MSRSIKKSITIPNPVRDALNAQLETGVLNYLQDVIERLPVTRPCDLDALLPANWAAANRAAHPATKSERRQAA
jgi:hypothetical protein